jgi:DNA-binding transcriptional LysR family regulator
MELRQIEYVLAVAEERHFGRAAERLHVRQQSVSEQVRRLERELGAPLFARTSRRVALTPVGEAFVPEARRAVLAARAPGTSSHAGPPPPAGARSASATPRTWGRRCSRSPRAGCPAATRRCARSRCR